MNNFPQSSHFYRRQLPHWEVAEACYFVTIRLKGAIPKAGLDYIHQLREAYDRAIANGQTGLKQRRAVFIEMEKWLDRAPTVNYLTRPDIAEMIVEAIEHREQEGIWTVYSYALMPNHLHLFFSFGTTIQPMEYNRCSAWTQPACQSSAEPISLWKTISNFKRWTGNKANRLLDQPLHTRFWQREWFDHWSRTPEESDKIIRYIQANPIKAGLIREGEVWPWLR